MSRQFINARLVLSTLVLYSTLLDLAYGAEPTRPTYNDDVLLTAINFALSGHDGITYKFSDRLECVVTKDFPSAQQGVQAVETFYLNNIDASRIAFLKMQSKSEYEVENFTRVELHGESVVRENKFDPEPPTLQPLQFTDVTLDLHTTEYDRLVRAWRYIYSHGCKSAKSSF